jgi:CRP/FNR family cyclic AMP-dependent transcriptional regulator
MRHLLPGLSEQAAQELAAGTRSLTFERGEDVVGYGADLLPGVVADGAVRLNVRSADGREATLRVIGRGKMFGLVTLFDSAAHVSSVGRSVTAAEVTTCLLFDPATLKRLAGRHSELAVHIAHQLADSASCAADMAGQFAFMTVRQRVAGHLVAIAESDPDGRPVAFVTQQELANAIGSVREVVARALHGLRDDRLVALSPGRIEILDADRLVSVS